MRNLILSVDKLNDLSTCPRLYYFKQILRKVPPAKPKYFSEGEFMHKILEFYYRDMSLKRLQAISFYREIALNQAAEFSDLSTEESEVLIKLFEEYLIHYSGDNWLALGSEEPFAKVLLEDEGLDLRVIIRGKIDLRVKTPVIEEIIVDHKVVSQNRPIHSRANQNLAYLWATDAKDFILNSIGKQKTLAPDKKFRREYFNYGRYQIEEWKEATIDSILDLLRYYEMNHFPARFTGCTRYGMKCSYYDICESTMDNWEYKLSSYDDRPELDIMEEKDYGTQD